MTNKNNMTVLKFEPYEMITYFSKEKKLDVKYKLYETMISNYTLVSYEQAIKDLHLKISEVKTNLYLEDNAKYNEIISYQFQIENYQNKIKNLMSETKLFLLNTTLNSLSLSEKQIQSEKNLY